MALVLAFTMAVPRVSADQTFHTEQIPLMALGGAPLSRGFVIDVHAEGPTIFAQERYVLVGAVPNNTYQVALSIYPDMKCALPPVLTIPEAKLITNGAGNGEAGFTFYNGPGVPGPGTYNLQWHVLLNGAAAYQTPCTPVKVG
jgi:hypothetical protein